MLATFDCILPFLIFVVRSKAKKGRKTFLDVQPEQCVIYYSCDLQPQDSGLSLDQCVIIIPLIRWSCCYVPKSLTSQLCPKYLSIVGVDSFVLVLLVYAAASSVAIFLDCIFITQFPQLLTLLPNIIIEIIYQLLNVSFPLSRCSNSQSGDLTKADRAVDGIFGFGQHPLSVISQLNSLGVSPRVFSHCLKGSDNGGGILVLGEIVEPGLVYTPLVPSQ